MAAGLLKNIAESFFSKVVDYGLEWVTGKKDSKLETLQRSLKSLSDLACDIKDQIKHEEQAGNKKRKRGVENWLEEEQKIESEVGALQNEGFLGRFFGGGRVSELNTRVRELLEQSKQFSKHPLVARENRGELLLTTRLTGKMFEKNVKVIWEWLVNDKVKSIGIYGMGGVGKTTLAKHINNQLRNENHRVYWVTVSQVFTTNKLQSDIAKAIDLDLSDVENEDKRAARLNQSLSKKEDFVLILDDVWDDIDLLQMGDPLGVDGCRLIVTTRSFGVCRRIDCEQNIEVKTLQTNESWTLFRETLGGRTTMTSNVEEIAKCVAKECDGLPLGIIVLAKSMKGVTDIREWRNVYNEIRESPMELNDLKDKVFRVPKYSFDRLDPEFHEKRRRNGYTKLQLCFLYCSLYPEDYQINKDALVRRFIAEELVDTRKSWEEQLDHGNFILSTLVNLCLLEHTSMFVGLTFEKQGGVKMHDLVRDMAIKIVRESSKHMVFAGLGLQKIPNEEEWTEDVDKISLMRNEIQEIPIGMAPKCPKLATLLLNGNPLKSIPESFFAKMSGLRILDLSYTSIRELPNSLSDLESLNTLHLNNCKDLVSLPLLGKLKALRELDLSNTSITRLPDSLSDLESLNTLLLKNCKDLVSLPFLGKLKALRELDLSGTSITRLPNWISDLESVYRLCLGKCFLLVFVPSLEKLEALRELDLSHTSIRDVPKGMENLINLNILLFKGTKYLKLQPGDLRIKSQNLQHLEFPFEIEVPVREIVESLKRLNRFVGRFKDISDFNWFQSQTGGLISKFTYIVSNGFWDVDGYFPFLGRNWLLIEGCSLRREGEDGAIILPEKVPSLVINRCKGLSGWVLDDLCASIDIDSLRIEYCEGIESIWNINDQLMAETTIKVESVTLRRLPDFKGLVNWEEGGLGRLPQAVMIFSSLTKLRIYHCDKMKKLGLPLSCLHNVTRIQVSNCGEIEELIELDEDYEEISQPTHSLPNLKRLFLKDLPKLKSICKARIDCKSIRIIDIRECPRVKKLPLFLPSSSDGGVISYSPPPALEQINIEEQVWESLEWDDDIRHKHLLQPFVHFIRI